MYKNLIFIGSNELVIEHFFNNLKKKAFLLLDSNIIELEKNKARFNIPVYPLSNNDHSFFILTNLFKNKFKKINEVVFSVDYFLGSISFSSINLNHLRFFFDVNFASLFLLLNHIFGLLIESDKVFVTFIFNKGSLDKSNFLFLHECINNFLLTFMKYFNKEYSFLKNVYLNCISLENVDIAYKKAIYPYKFHKFNVNSLYLVYNEIVNKCFKNKILIV